MGVDYKFAVYAVLMFAEKIRGVDDMWNYYFWWNDWDHRRPQAMAEGLVIAATIVYVFEKLLTEVQTHQSNLLLSGKTRDPLTPPTPQNLPCLPSLAANNLLVLDNLGLLASALGKRSAQSWNRSKISTGRRSDKHILIHTQAQRLPLISAVFNRYSWAAASPLPPHPHTQHN
jgi:hypothetical protein